MKVQKIADNGGLSWYVFGRDTSKSEHVIDTNEYLVVHSSGDALLMDPGGTEIFPQVVAALSEVVQITDIKAFFASHQDPDIMSSLPLWLGLCPKAKVYMSWIWSGFIAHFGHEYVGNFITVPDEGISFQLGNSHLQLIPAHYCHSSGNFSLFDPVNRVLFSGDIGAALLPPEHTNMMVTDFQDHTRYMESFHRRWMPSNRAKNAWIRRVRPLKCQYICPQHGAIFEGENVDRFLDWFEKLDVGSAV